MALGTTGLVVAAALVAGAAGAGAAALVLETSRPAALPADSGGAQVPALEERLARQEKELESLRARLEEMAQARKAPSGGAPGSSGTSHPAPVLVNSSGTVQIFDPATGKPVPSPGDEATAANADDITPAEQAKFEAAYKRMRAKEQEEAAKARLAAQATGLRLRLDRLPENLALTDAQKDGAVKILMDRNEKLRQAFTDLQAAGGAGGAEGARIAQEKVAAIRQDATQQLQQSLTQDQVRAVEQVADRGGGQGRIGAFNGGNGGRRGNGGAGQPPGGQPAAPPR